MNRTHMRIFATASASLLLLSSCGGDDDLSADDTELAAALATQWTEEGEFPEGVDIDCIATAFISGVGGAEGAADYGVNAKNIENTSFEDNSLNEDDAMAAATKMFTCGGLEAAFVGGIDPRATDEQISCLVDEIDETPLIKLLASEFMGDMGAALEDEFDDTFETDLFAAVAACDISM